MMLQYGEIIGRNCKRFNLSPALIAAIIHVESGGDQWAVRYEPRFYDKYLKNKTWDKLEGFHPSAVSQRTEYALRATSFGLMQVLGQTARELGFEGEFLTELLQPELAIEYGCMYLDKCLKKTNDDQVKALLLYNGGGNKAYPTLVLDHVKSKRAEYLLK